MSAQKREATCSPERTLLETALFGGIEVAQTPAVSSRFKTIVSSSYLFPFLTKRMSWAPPFTLAVSINARITND